MDDEDDRESDDEIDEATENTDDAGTLVSKARSKRSQVSSYNPQSSGSEDDSSASADEEGSDTDAAAPAKPSTAKKATSSTPKKTPVKKDKKEKKADRVAAVKEASPNVAAYDYDHEKGEFCFITFQFPSNLKPILFVSLIERIASKVLLRATVGIKQCRLAKKNETDVKPNELQVEGMNLRELWNYPGILNLNKLRTNDIYAMLQIYGVEAARATLIGQINEVFKVYAIEVDPHHLTLVADAMMFSGGYRAMNRLGIKHNPSPLLKMSFETTFDFLRQACSSGDSDTLQSHSARLVTGKATSTGTGIFGLMQPLVAS